MADPRSVMQEFRFLEQKRQAGSLTPAEAARHAELRDLVGFEQPLPARGGFDVSAAAAQLRESLLPAGLRSRPAGLAVRRRRPSSPVPWTPPAPAEPPVAPEPEPVRRSPLRPGHARPGGPAPGVESGGPRLRPRRALRRGGLDRGRLRPQRHLRLVGAGRGVPVESAPPSELAPAERAPADLARRPRTAAQLEPAIAELEPADPLRRRGARRSAPSWRRPTSRRSSSASTTVRARRSPSESRWSRPRRRRARRWRDLVRRQRRSLPRCLPPPTPRPSASTMRRSP